MREHREINFNSDSMFKQVLPRLLCRSCVPSEGIKEATQISLLFAASFGQMTSNRTDVMLALLSLASCRYADPMKEPVCGGGGGTCYCSSAALILWDPWLGGLPGLGYWSEDYWEVWRDRSTLLNCVCGGTGQEVFGLGQAASVVLALVLNCG